MNLLVRGVEHIRCTQQCFSKSIVDFSTWGLRLSL